MERTGENARSPADLAGLRVLWYRQQRRAELEVLCGVARRLTPDRRGALRLAEAGSWHLVAVYGSRLVSPDDATALLA